MGDGLPTRHFPATSAGLGPRCHHCARPLTARGLFDDWLLFACVPCDLVWRITSWELLAALRAGTTLRGNHELPTPAPDGAPPPATCAM